MHVYDHDCFSLNKSFLAFLTNKNNGDMILPTIRLSIGYHLVLWHWKSIAQIVSVMAKILREVWDNNGMTETALRPNFQVLARYYG